MPLHDWSKLENWEGLHHTWMTELLRWVKPRLPEGYRAYIGNLPLLAIGARSEKPDVSVRRWPGEGSPPEQASGNGAAPESASGDEPLLEVAVASLARDRTLFVESRGFLVAAVELISPRNKDRPSSRQTYFTRYVGYLLQGVHLLLVDVHRRRRKFSFPDRIARELGFEQPPCPAPCAVSYRVGEPTPDGGHLLAVWPRQLTLGAPPPTVELPLNVYQSVKVDLEQTYARAAADLYLE
jgi:hypothetical protein